MCAIWAEIKFCFYKSKTEVCHSAHLVLPTVYNSGIYSSILNGYMVFRFVFIELIQDHFKRSR